VTRASILALLGLILLLGGCAAKPSRPASPAVPSDDAPARTREQPARRGPLRARPDQPGEYTAGGLYKPGVADSGPAVPPDISALVEPTPVDEPRARYGNRSPYTVLGRSYHVMPSARGYRQRGIASWYGEKFHGRATSSLEPYDMLAFSAAHKTLPLPTYARVTNLENGRSVVVRVNDRGPFHADRLIDLSYAAAIKLGMHIKGTARVEVEALSGDGAATSTSHRSVSAPRIDAPSADTSRERWLLQVASFSDKDNAKRLADRLEDADVERVRIQRAKVRGDRVWRVRIGPLERRDLAEQVAARVRALGLGQPTVVAE
jgi:rare lipoprotein A